MRSSMSVRPSLPSTTNRISDAASIAKPTWFSEAAISSARRFAALQAEAARVEQRVGAVRDLGRDDVAGDPGLVVDD